MKAKTRAENEAEGEVRGSAQMASCQRPAVNACVRACVYVCSCHAYVRMLHVCGAHLLPLLSCVHPCMCARVCVPSELCVRGAVLPRWHWQTDTARLAELARLPGAQLALPATMLSPMYRGEGTCCQPPKLIDRLAGCRPTDSLGRQTFLRLRSFPERAPLSP